MTNPIEHSSGSPRIGRAAIRRALLFAVIVGPILTVINQGDAVMAGDGLHPLKTPLTFMVPFCVSLISSWLATKDAAE